MGPASEAGPPAGGRPLQSMVVTRGERIATPSLAELRDRHRRAWPLPPGAWHQAGAARGLPRTEPARGPTLRGCRARPLRPTPKPPRPVWPPPSTGRRGGGPAPGDETGHRGPRLGAFPQLDAAEDAGCVVDDRDSSGRSARGGRSCRPRYSSDRRTSGPGMVSIASITRFCHFLVPIRRRAASPTISLYGSPFRNGWWANSKCGRS